MAQFKINGIDEMMRHLEALGGNVEATAKEAVKEALPILEQSMAAGVRSAANRGYSTGGTASSVKARDVRVNEKGVYGTVGFSGSNPKGTRYAEIAGYLEYGTCRQVAHPYMQKSIKSAEPKAKATMEQVFENAMSKFS